MENGSGMSITVHDEGRSRIAVIEFPYIDRSRGVARAVRHVVDEAANPPEMSVPLCGRRRGTSNQAVSLGISCLRHRWPK
jgi:hypothetical protein